MANCGLLLNDGTTFVGLNDGFAILLNDNSCAFEPGAGATQETDNKGGGGYIGGFWSRKQWHTVIGEIEAERKLVVDAEARRRAAELRKAETAKQAAHDDFLSRLNQAEAEHGRLVRALAQQHAEQTMAQQAIAQRMAEQHAQQQEFIRQIMDEDEEAFALLEQDD